jgi:hypothetical protein
MSKDNRLSSVLAMILKGQSVVGLAGRECFSLDVVLVVFDVGASPEPPRATFYVLKVASVALFQKRIARYLHPLFV